ncbi:WD40-repeat-containing domain protein [Armillaria nabsnona]|nr:WD40-repeat-containing domain protein [Armillaria nabsnona]
MSDAMGYQFMQSLDVDDTVNCLIFWHAGDTLISGGDDQTIRCWDLKSGECCQSVRDWQWDQVTVIDLYEDSRPAALNPTVLLVGTGRGLVSVIPKCMPEFNTQKATMTNVFDSLVECQVVNSANSHFAVASHTGMVKVFSIEDSVTLIPLWEIDVGDIPHNLAFEGNNNVQIIIHTLYNSELLLYNALTGVSLLPPIELNGGVGSAAFSPNRNTMAIHSLESNTFDTDLRTSKKRQRQQKLAEEAEAAKAEKEANDRSCALEERLAILDKPPGGSTSDVLARLLLLILLFVTCEHIIQVSYNAWRFFATFLKSIL